MAGSTALQRLLVWLSPAFPVGSFAWSGGLESAIIDGRTVTADTVRDWIAGTLRHGGLRTDAILLAHAYRAAETASELAELAELATALIPARERRDEVLTTGDAFIAAALTWPSEVFLRLPRPCPYAIAVGAVAAAHDIELADVLICYLTAAVHAQISVAVRLVPLGQIAGLTVMARLEPDIAAIAGEAAAVPLSAIGGIAYAADIAQMRHETLEPRLFRS